MIPSTETDSYTFLLLEFQRPRQHEKASHTSDRIFDWPKPPIFTSPLTPVVFSLLSPSSLEESHKIHSSIYQVGISIKMPRKKQKGAPSHANRPGGGPKPKPGSASTQSPSKRPNMDPVKDSGPKRQPQQNQRPIVPFLRGDRILLIGEGELIV